MHCHAAALVIVVSSIACSVSSAFAQSDAGAKLLFDQLDQNQDEIVDRSEVNSTQLPHFERLLRVSDRNQDGRLEAREFENGLKESDSTNSPFATTDRPTRRNLDPTRFFARLDRNSDGKVARDEIPEPLKERFERLFNATGKESISLEELKRLQAYREGQPPTPEPDPPAMTMMTSETNSTGPVWRTLDRNNDGKLTAVELQLAPMRLLALDKNRDGEISADEYE